MATFVPFILYEDDHPIEVDSRPAHPGLGGEEWICVGSLVFGLETAVFLVLAFITARVVHGPHPRPRHLVIWLLLGVALAAMSIRGAIWNSVWEFFLFPVIGAICYARSQPRHAPPRPAPGGLTTARGRSRPGTPGWAPRNRTQQGPIFSRTSPAPNAG